MRKLSNLHPFCFYDCWHCLTVQCITATVCRWHPVVHRLLCKWCCLTSVHSWVLPSLLTLLVLSQWSSSESQ